MCGIAGYFGSRTLEAAAIEKCLGLMHHRGPDHATHRHWVNRAGNNVYLLHSRLSIIDLDPRAQQPFHYGPTWMIYNGELYNYLEVRQELARSGHQFSTESDTEVLAQILTDHGETAMDRCEGMWALGLYDERDDSLTLSRDRFGEKPLYLYRDETGLYFGSEIKFLMAMAGRRFTVNTDQLYRYMINGYKALYKGSAGFFEGVSELPSATLLRLDAEGRESRSTYWKPAFRPDESLSYEDAVAGVKERLIRSVELRLRADVPLAFCLSGGVDSNSLIGIAKRVFDYDVHGFTIVNSDARYAEQEMVEHSARELGIRHTAIPVRTENFLDQLRTLVRHHDAPVCTITYYCHWLLMQSVSEHGYRISISGTAADEIFSGYYDHHLAYLYEVRNDAALYARSRAAWESYVQPVVRNPHLSDPDLFIKTPGFRDHIFFGADRLAQYFHEPWSEAFEEHLFTDSLLRNRMMNELFAEAVPVILHEDDLNAMYFSIENRSPFLDRELFEFAYRVPSRHLVQDGRAKALLRDAMNGIAPARVLEDRRKVGFNAPIHSFLDVRNPEVRSQVLDTSPIFDHVRRDRIEQLLGKEELPNSESKFLFYFLASKMFLEEFAA